MATVLIAQSRQPIANIANKSRGELEKKYPGLWLHLVTSSVSWLKLSLLLHLQNGHHCSALQCGRFKAHQCWPKLWERRTLSSSLYIVPSKMMMRIKQGQVFYPFDRVSKDPAWLKAFRKCTNVSWKRRLAASAIFRQGKAILSKHIVLRQCKRVTCLKLKGSKKPCQNMSIHYFLDSWRGGVKIEAH